MGTFILVVAIIRALLVTGLDVTEVGWCLTQSTVPAYCLNHPEKGDDIRLGS